MEPMQGSRRLAGTLHGQLLINIWLEWSEFNQRWTRPPLAWAIANEICNLVSPSKWDRLIIAIWNATIAALLRCVPLPCRLWHALFSDNTSCSGIPSIMDRLQYAWRYQNSSVEESQEPSFVCQCHDIIMSLSDGVFHWKDGHAGEPAVLMYSFCYHPPLAVLHTEQKSNKEQTECICSMSLVNSKWRRQWQCHSAYKIKCQRHGAPLVSDDIGDDQLIKHSGDDRPNLTWYTYYCTVLYIF